MTMVKEERTVDADDIAFTPTGDIIATNVQSAIAEVDTEKVKRITSVDNEIARFHSTKGDVQGYTSKAPTIDDDGEANFPGGLKTIDPTDEHGVGDRGYNDARYSGINSYYGEMYQASNAIATVIDTADEWYAVRLFSTGEVSNWTFDAGSTGVIASIANAGGGDVIINDVAHGLSAGDMISITGTTNYNGLYEVKTVTIDSFTITATWGVSETGKWNQGSSLTAGSGAAGKYIMHFSVTLTPQINNHIFTFATAKNAIDCPKCRARQKAGNAGDYHSISSTSIHDVSVGDIIYLVVKNINATGNVTIRHSNLNLEKL